MIDGVGPIITATGALIGVLVLVALAAWLARIGGWVQRPRTGKLLALLETMALDGQRRLLLVQCGEQQVVLLTGGPQDLVVGWMRRPGPSGSGVTELEAGG